MAFDIGAIIARIKADTTEFENGMNKVRREADSAGENVKGLGERMKDLSGQATLVTAAITAGFGLVAKSAIESASSFEQNRVAFETMLGSADKAKTLMKDISDFALKTPFELPQLVDGAQRLLAYNIAGEKVIPTLQMLGNIAAGVGTDKLPQLILAFGQVNAATKLTGAELRQFSEAGVPLLEALVNQANEAGGVMTKVGGATKETTKQMSGLASKIANTEFEMDFFRKTGGKTDDQLKTMQKTIDLNKAKLGQFGDVGQEVYRRVKVTAEEMIQKVSDGDIKFADVNKALESMTGEGGKFFNLMEKQSQTFGGVMSNIRDQIGRVMRSVMGIDEGGDIAEGSIFARMKDAANALFKFLEDATPMIVGGVNNAVNTLAHWFGVLAEALEPVGTWVRNNSETVLTFLKGFVAAIAGFLIILTVIGAFNPFILALAAVGTAAGLIAVAFDNIPNSVKGAFANLKDVIEGYIDNFVGMFDAFKERLADSFNLDQNRMDLAGFFGQMAERIAPAMQEVTRQIQQGFTNAFEFMPENNIGDVLGRLMSTAQTVADIFFRVLTPAIEELKEKFAESKPEIDKFLQLIGPLLINALQVAATIIGVVATAIIGIVFTLVNTFANALNGLLTFFNGVMELITGFFTILNGIFHGNWEMILEGFKMMGQGIIDIFVGFISAVIGAVYGFVEGIIKFFQNLYDVLVGHSIIPDLVKAIIQNFTDMFTFVTDLVRQIVTFIVNKFIEIKNQVLSTLETLKNSIFDKFNAIWDGLKNIGGKILDALISPFNEAKRKIEDTINWIKSNIDFTQRHSPSVVDIVTRGVDKVNQALQELQFNPNLTAGGVATSITNGGPSVNHISVMVDLSGAYIGSEFMAEQYGESVGDSIIRKLQANIRT